MRVLVAGATGAIERPLISALVASRREVIGITSAEQGVQTLRDKGAEAFVADALDRDVAFEYVRRGAATGCGEVRRRSQNILPIAFGNARQLAS